MQIQLYGNKIWLYSSAVDFRKSIDGLSTIIVNELQQHPQSGVYVFYNKSKDKVKCLSWHKNGFILFYKRIESGKFKFNFVKQRGTVMLTSVELGWLLAGLDWQSMRSWKELDYEKFS
jgi:transposase